MRSPYIFALVSALAANVHADIIFQDTFNRADNRNIQASLDGITDNTGSGLIAGTPGTVYANPFVDPNNMAPTYGVQDGNSANGGGIQILSNQLQLAVGVGTSNAVVGHNFINSSILAAGGFALSLNVTSTGTTGPGPSGRFAGFGIGMSDVDILLPNDAENGSPSAFRMTGAVGTNYSNVVSDFYAGLRGDNNLVFGIGTTTPTLVNVGAATGIISAEFSFSDFNMGTTVSYNVYFNNTLQGSGTFTWSETNANFIGLDGRAGDFVGLDDLTIATIPEPQTVFLLGLGTGLVIWRFSRKQRAA